MNTTRILRFRRTAASAVALAALGSVSREFEKWFAGFERIEESRRKLSIKLRSFFFPGESTITHVTDDFRWIADGNFSLGNHHLRRDETKCANDAAGSNHGAVHNNSVHPDKRIAADTRTVNNRTVTDVGTALEEYCRAGKHMDRAVFLDVTTVFDDNFAEVAADHGSRANVHFPADDDIPHYGRIRVNKRRFADDGPKALKGKEIRHRSWFQNRKG